MIVTVLTRQVKSSTPVPVLDEHIGAVVTEELHGPAEPPGGGHVEGGQPVKLVLAIHPGPGLHQQPRSLQVTSGTRQVEGGAPSLGRRGFIDKHMYMTFKTHIIENVSVPSSVQEIRHGLSVTESGGHVQAGEAGLDNTIK